MIRLTARAALAGLLLFAGAGPLLAQRPMPIAAPRGPAGALLAARTQLGLTEEQVRRLEALATQQAAGLAPNPGDMLRARADLLDAMKGEGDAAALKRAMDKAHQLRTERALAMLKARQEARAILTADQRSRADALRAARRGMAREMRRGMGRGLRRGRPDGAAPGMMPGWGPGAAPMGRPDARPGRPGNGMGDGVGNGVGNGQP